MTRSSMWRFALASLIVLVACGVFLSLIGLPKDVVRYGILVGTVSLVASLTVPLWLMIVHKSSWSVANAVAAVGLIVWGFAWSLALFGNGPLMTTFMAIMVGSALSLSRLCIKEAINVHLNAPSQ